jgi:hypothetical protein
MMTGMAEETLEAKLKRHEDALVACMAEITRLREENARLRSSENNAHSVLREVYNDPTASPAVRVKAAGLALPHETPRLAPVEAPLELVAEPVIPLAELVEKRRARSDRMLRREDPQFLAVRSYQAIALKPNGNGNGDDQS